MTIGNAWWMGAVMGRRWELCCWHGAWCLMLDEACFYDAD